MNEQVEAIIRKCNPETAAMRFKTGGTYGSEGVFDFVRRIRPLFETVDEAEPVFRVWYAFWMEKIVDEVGYKMPLEEVLLIAGDVWDKPRHTGDGIPFEIIDAAHTRLVGGQTIAELNGYGGDKERILAFVCFELSQKQHPQPFWISQYDAAEVMGLNRVNGQKRARRVLRVFEQKKIIDVVQKGNAVRATRYQFNGTINENCP